MRSRFNRRMITVEKIDDPEYFAGCRSEWNELLGASDSDGVFLTWEWLFCWWKHLAGARRLHLLLVRERGEPVAIAPFALRARRWRRLLPFPAVEFLGMGSVASDYLDILVRRHRQPGVLAALADFLAANRYMLDLQAINPAGANVSGLVAELSRQGWGLERRAQDVCPFIDLSGHDWPSFLQSLGSSHRYNLRRRLRNLEKRADLRFERIRSEEQRVEAMRILIALHGSRWRRRGCPGAFHSPELVAFHDEFSRLALERGWLRLYVLRLNGEPAAALYGLLYKGDFYFYQSGFNQDYQRQSVGLVTMGLAIRSAIEEGAKTYDFLRGSESYKYRWTRTERELLRLEFYPPGGLGSLCRQTMELRGGIKKLLSPEDTSRC